MREHISSVSPKGQITIPAEIRRVLGVGPKDKIAFLLEDGRVEITPARSPLDALYQAVPALNPPRSWSEIEQIVRDEQAERAAKSARKESE